MSPSPPTPPETDDTVTGGKAEGSIRVLVVDNDIVHARTMGEGLARLGHDVTVVGSGSEGARRIEQEVFDVVVTDLMMNDIGGLEILARAKRASTETEVIVVTGHGTIPSAVSAMQQGAFTYLQKPLDLGHLRTAVEKASEGIRLRRQNLELNRRLDEKFGFEGVIGSSPQMLALIERMKRIAPTDATVLIQGETGTGKELVARAIHEASPRADRPLVAVNCGSLPEHLVERELFGHRKGAFTGADEHRAGLFEVADGGTLFLDEIGELPKPLQPRLLRALESGEIRRVGENQSHTVDVRVVCATHRSLEEMAAAGEFRDDLLFRINTFEILLPPLRDRRDDIPELVQYFVRHARPQTPAAAAVASYDVLAILAAHHWPGNVRELANVVEHALVLCDDLPLQVDHLPARLGAAAISAAAGRPQPGPAAVGGSTEEPPAAVEEQLTPRPESLRELEMRAILEGLDRNNGNKARTAEELGISLKTLYNKLHQLQESK